MSWNEIDHEIVRHKLSLISQEMQPKVVSEERRVLFECRQKGNIGSIKSSLVAMHVMLTDEWLERTYQAYCEVWATQQKTKSSDFVRAVFQNALVPLIAVRQGVIISSFDLMANRKREHSSRPERDAVVRALARLREKWFDRLEIEAESCKYVQKASSEMILGPAVQRQGSDYVSVWDQIDHTLVALKGQEPLDGHIESIDKERRQIEWDHRKNQHACAAAILEMAEHRADEWMVIRLGIYCEVWKLQNKVANADFYSTFRDKHRRACHPGKSQRRTIGPD